MKARVLQRRINLNFWFWKLVICLTYTVLGARVIETSVEPFRSNVQKHKSIIFFKAHNIFCWIRKKILKLIIANFHMVLKKSIYFLRKNDFNNSYTYVDKKLYYGIDQFISFQLKITNNCWKILTKYWKNTGLIYI